MSEQLFLIKGKRFGMYFLNYNQGSTTRRENAHAYTAAEVKVNHFYKPSLHVLIPTVPFETSVNLEVPYEPIGD